jgi:tetratricopeptide (TPR) repeat protein
MLFEALFNPIFHLWEAVLYKRTTPVFFCIMLLFSGCADLPQTIESEYYLSGGKYRQGEASANRVLQKDPNDPLANYYAGRFLLAQKKYATALPHLEKAVKHRAKNPEYLFWLGVAYGLNKKTKTELASYRRVLKINPRHIGALTYLAHGLLHQRKYKVSLKTYKKLLALVPRHPSAIYNTGLIMLKLGRKPQAQTAWKLYLQYYPHGRMAVRAAQHLNAAGDFSYRVHYLGKIRMVTPDISFQPFSANLTDGSRYHLERIAARLMEMPNLTVHVICYQLNNLELAKAKALAVKRSILAARPALDPGHIKVSWFRESQNLSIGKRRHQIDQSVVLFGLLPEAARQKVKRK